MNVWEKVIKSESEFSMAFSLILRGLKIVIKIENYYVYKIFVTNHKWLVVTSSNLNLSLRLHFYLNNNNQ